MLPFSFLKSLESDTQMHRPVYSGNTMKGLSGEP
jgi:hypothetical protein